MLTAVLFDVDGTLVDSERHGHRVAFNRAFADLDLPYEWDEDTYGQLLDIAGGRQRLRHFLVEQGHPEGEAAELAAKLHEHKTSGFTEFAAAGELPPRPGVAPLLDGLDEAGVLVAVVTTGTRAWVEPMLDTLFGQGRFAFVLTRDEVADLKPDPAVYEAGKRELADRGITGGAVAVEDSRNGVVAAHAAGLPCLVVVNGYTREQDFTEAQLVVEEFGAVTVETLRELVQGA